MKNNKRYLIIFLGILSTIFFVFIMNYSQRLLFKKHEQNFQKQLSEHQKEKELSSTPAIKLPTNTIAPPTNTPTPTTPPYAHIEDFSVGEVVSLEQIDTGHLSDYFTISEIDQSLEERIMGKSYTENPHISLSELRYLKLLHYNFDHKIQVGELIVNEGIANDCIDIFTELFKAEYEIESMYLIDNYWTGDGTSTDTASMNDNNSSAFCYRVITGSSKLSNHAYGYAIDINPYQNPYITYKNGVPVFYHDNAQDYADRNAPKEHMINHDDLCYQLFTSHGFTWGGDWKNSKDYQHFEKKQ